MIRKPELMKISVTPVIIVIVIIMFVVVYVRINLQEQGH